MNDEHEQATDFSQGENDTMNEAAENQESFDDILLTGDENQEQVSEQPNARDWKAEAIKAQTRLEMLEQMRDQQQAATQEPQVDEITRIRQEIEQVRAGIPALDDKNPQTFWDRERAKDKLNELNEKLMETRLRQQERMLAEQSVGSVVQSFKQQHANNARFRAVEQKFDQAVRGLEPHLRGNTTMLDFIRKNLEYDEMTRQANGPKAPPAAPNAAYQPQANAPANRGKVSWKSDADRQVGEYYVARGIISGPEEFYDPKFNENSKTANNNGVAIYDVPTTPRGWRR